MTNDSTVTCPKCGAEIPLSQAVSHRVREQLAGEFEQQRRELNSAIAGREEALTAAQAKLEARQAALHEDLERLLSVERPKLLREATQQVEFKLGAQLKDTQAQVEEQRLKLKEAQAAELGLRRRQRELDEAKASLDLEVARKLDAERGKIAETARQQAVETERLKLADKEQLIKGLQEQIAALKQRAEQGSTQAQGETLEIELENSLRSTFTWDEIVEVKKGQRGADVLQRVRTSAGLDCGAILWEAKRARNWASDWPEKLKEDQREAKAELAVLVTTCLPAGVRGIGQVDGVWVCEPAFAAALASALRHGVLASAVQRLQETDRGDKMIRLYDYLCSVEFRQHIEGVVEAFTGLQQQLAAEQRAFARQWKEREQQILKALQHTAILYGSIQGIAGRQALAEIKTLQIEAPPE